MKKSGFYIIKEQFFEDMNEPYLKGNKKENRPHYYCFEDENTGIYWMIPLSSKIEKYRKIMEKREAKGKASVTCQHALFIPGIGNSTYDILNMWMVKAKTALLWGQYTEEQYRNFNPNLKCEICGNPTITEKKYHENVAIIGIAMDLPRMHEYNQKMIDVVESYARNTSRKVRLRIHPADKKENYRVDGKICEFSSDLDDAFFIVAHTTTMIFTYLLSGKKVLKFMSNIPFFPVDKNMVFSTLDDLTKCVNHFDNFDGSKMAKNEISYIGEESAFKYKECLEN